VLYAITLSVVYATEIYLSDSVPGFTVKLAEKPSANTGNLYRGIHRHTIAEGRAVRLIGNLVVNPLVTPVSSPVVSPVVDPVASSNVTLIVSLALTKLASPVVSTSLNLMEGFCINVSHLWVFVMISHYTLPAGKDKISG
jgi:hypothetical protein